MNECETCGGDLALFGAGEGCVCNEREDSDETERDFDFEKDD
jgi:hypothetical protein